MADSKKEQKDTNEKTEKLVGTRGRTFEGFVTKKFPKRVVIEFTRTAYIPKYERFHKKKTKLHARLPDYLSEKIQIGDLIQIRECRPLSKLIHFIVINKVEKEKSQGAKQ